ncbi:hypothetical protein VNO77_42855 [Canavalia gladiata]|uniref:Uncharacterized protein n=1 Tax=Canavalia gladiata TaxID=3824 RepID=A0AAN9JWN8_CANGL
MVSISRIFTQNAYRKERERNGAKHKKRRQKKHAEGGIGGASPAIAHRLWPTSDRCSCFSEICTLRFFQRHFLL